MADSLGPIDDASKTARPRLVRWRSIGADGLLMLAASCVGILATGGLSLLLCFLHVSTVAVRTRCVPEATDSEDREKIILVPGVRLSRDGSPDRDFVARLSRAGLLPGAPIVILGGQTRAGVAVSEAMAGRGWLISNGLSADRILCEEASRNTLENLRAARNHFAAGGTVPVIVSNRYHLARIGILARGLGMRPILCAAEDRMTWTPLGAVRLLQEAFFIHWYYTGKTLARLLRQQQMLSRVS